MNYLQDIENEFSKIRGKWTPLAPLDWALAQTWEQKGIPTSVVFRAMDDVHKKFIAANPSRSDTINSLRYFEKGVENAFAEWQKSQVGKSDYIQEEENNMNYLEDYVASVETNMLNYLAEKFNGKNFPDPLNSAVAKAHDDLLALIKNVEKNGLSEADTERNLEAISADLELSLVVSLPEDARNRMLENIKREYAAITINADSRQKLLIKEAYKHFGLPKLTLFEL